MHRGSSVLGGDACCALEDGGELFLRRKAPTVARVRPNMPEFQARTTRSPGDDKRRP